MPKERNLKIGDHLFLPFGLPNLLLRIKGYWLPNQGGEKIKKKIKN
jgi:hypothetical protein